MCYNDLNNISDDYSQNNYLFLNSQDFNFLNEINDNPFLYPCSIDTTFFIMEKDDKYIYDNNNLPNINNEEQIFSKNISNNVEYLIKELSINTKYTTKLKKKDLIFQITKNENKKKTILGRKRNNCKNNIKSKHDKFSSDNIVRKIKAKLFDSILFLLNSSLKKNSKKMFLKIEQKIIKDINVNNNKILLKTKLKDIFSKNISIKLINYGLDYNKKLINQIYKENIEIKTISILEKTFLECLEHFRGSKYYIELDGLEKEYNNTINYLKDKDETEEYINSFKNLVDNFEESYNSKKPRISRINTINYYFFN